MIHHFCESHLKCQRENYFIIQCTEHILCVLYIVQRTSIRLRCCPTEIQKWPLIEMTDKWGNSTGQSHNEKTDFGKKTHFENGEDLCT